MIMKKVIYNLIFLLLSISCVGQHEVLPPSAKLTSSLFEKEGVSYSVKYDYNLNGDTLVVPSSCRLHFDGGKIYNGYIKGKIENDYLKPEWFGAKGDGVHDDQKAFSQAIALGKKLVLEKKTYKIASASSWIVFSLNHDLEIDGNGATLLLTQSLYSNKKSVLLFSDKEKPQNSDKFFHDFDIIVEVDNVADYDYNFYMFNLYSENVKFDNVRILNKGRTNGVNCITIGYAKQVTIDNCYFDNQHHGKRGGMLWMMLKDKPSDDSTFVAIKNSTFIHDTKDETICFSSSGANVSDCYIRFTVDKCNFKSPNVVNGSGFIICYDNRKTGQYVYDVRGTFSRCQFESMRNAKNPENGRPVFQTQRGAAVIPKWNVVFDECKIVSKESYRQINGKNNVWMCSYCFSPASYKNSTEGSFSLLVKNSTIKTNNSLLNGYTGGCAGKISFENCDIDCKAMRIGTANVDKVLSDFYVINSNVKVDFPYTFGGNEYWRNSKISSPNAFLISPFPKQVKLKKVFENSNFNGKRVNPNIKYSKDGSVSFLSCGWSHSIYGNDREYISGLICSPQNPPGVSPVNMVVK